MIRRLLQKLLGGSVRLSPVMGSKAANDLVRADMLKSGDDGTIPRKIRHVAYPKDKLKSASLYEVFDFLSEYDLALSELGLHGGIQADEWGPIASEEFDAFTSKLFDELDAMGWRYDGWDCPIVTG